MNRFGILTMAALLAVPFVSACGESAIMGAGSVENGVLTGASVNATGVPEFGAAGIRATTQQALLLWGGVDANGVPHLDPSFVLDGPSYPYGSEGPHRIAGRDADGLELFSLRFEMPKIAGGDGTSGFVLTIPAREEWADRLASITLSGPGGSVTMDRNTDQPMAILINPESGQIREIVRDLPTGPEGRQVAERIAAETGFDLFFSRGIPDPEEWRRSRDSLFR